MELLAVSLDLPRAYFDSTCGAESNVQMKIARYPPVGPGGYCSPHHRMPYDSTEVNNALDDVAGDMYQALPAGPVGAG